MKTCILTLLFLFSFEVINAQSIGELKLKTNMSYGEKKFKNNNGKIYVHSFIVNYQIMFEAEKNKAATSTFGGGYKGAQHAAVVTTLEGVEASLLNKMTDQLFAYLKQN
jgi:uncharacterized membrane protein